MSQLTDSQITMQMKKNAIIYSNKGYISWHQTWFGSLLRKFKLPTRHFPYKWIGHWKVPLFHAQSKSDT